MELTDEEETGFKSWYSAIAKANNLPDDPDEAVSDNGEEVTIDHRKFFKRIVDDPDFAEGVENLIKHSQNTLDTGQFYKHTDSGAISTINSIGLGDAEGVEHIFPSVWGGKIYAGEESGVSERAAKDSGLKWPTAATPEEGEEISKWVHQLVMNQKPRTPVGERALRLGL